MDWEGVPRIGGTGEIIHIFQYSMSPPHTLFSRQAPLWVVLSLSGGETPLSRSQRQILSIITTLRSLPQPPPAFIISQDGPFSADYPWLSPVHDDTLACWMSQDHRKPDLIIIFKQPDCAFIKHRMVICIFWNIPTILHPFCCVACKSTLGPHDSE